MALCVLTCRSLLLLTGSTPRLACISIRRSGFVMLVVELSWEPSWTGSGAWFMLPPTVFWFCNAFTALEKVSKLPGTVKNELVLAAILSLTAVTDLRVGYCEDVYGTDASSFSGAVVKTRVHQKVAEELWRVGEHRGFHTRLLGSSGEYLQSVGLAQPVEDGCDDGQRPAHVPSRWIREFVECSSFVPVIVKVFVASLMPLDCFGLG
eukprot:4688020-Amphidinium_carterae.2